MRRSAFRARRQERTRTSGRFGIFKVSTLRVASAVAAVVGWSGARHIVSTSVRFTSIFRIASLSCLGALRLWSVAVARMARVPRSFPPCEVFCDTFHAALYVYEDDVTSLRDAASPRDSATLFSRAVQLRGNSQANLPDSSNQNDSDFRTTILKPASPLPIVHSTIPKVGRFGPPLNPLVKSPTTRVVTYPDYVLPRQDSRYPSFALSDGATLRPSSREIPPDESHF